MRVAAPSFLLVLLLTACSGGGNWVNPALPKDRADSDLARCRAEAEDSMGPAAYLPPGEERTGNPMTLVDRTNNAKKFESLVGRCMAGLGYRQAK